MSKSSTAVAFRRTRAKPLPAPTLAVGQDMLPSTIAGRVDTLVEVKRRLSKLKKLEEELRTHLLREHENNPTRVFASEKYVLNFNKVFRAAYKVEAQTYVEIRYLAKGAKGAK